MRPALRRPLVDLARPFAHSVQTMGSILGQLQLEVHAGNHVDRVPTRNVSRKKLASSACSSVVSGATWTPLRTWVSVYLSPATH